MGPEYISARPGAAGQRVHYLAADKVINLANGVFGFNGWSSAIKAITIDFIDEHAHTGRISLGLSVIVRVTLRDGTYHEDIGYGQIENCKGKAAAFEKAKKEGTTDGLKRALRTFGNVLGNCIYDKNFLEKVTKIKVTPSRWDSDNLHRHPDFMPAKKENVQEESEGKVGSLERCNTSNTEGEDEFGGADFSHADFGSDSHLDHPDEVTLPAEAPYPVSPTRPNNVASGPGRPLGQLPRPPNLLANGNPAGSSNQQLPKNESGQVGMNQSRANKTAPVPEIPPYNNNKNNNNNRNKNTINETTGNHQKPPGQNQQQQPRPQAPAAAPVPHGTVLPEQTTPNNQNHPQHQQPANVGFYSARAASALNEPSPNGPTSAASPVPTFNPHSESPSIRKTVGVDHSRSIPVKRTATGNGVVIGPDPPSRGAATPPREGVASPIPNRNFVNPSSDMHRRIGAPVNGAGGGAMASPGAKATISGMNASAYRPPAKRPLSTSDTNVNPTNPSVNTNVNANASGNLVGDQAPKGNTPNLAAAAGPILAANPAVALPGTTAGPRRPPLSNVSTNIPSPNHQNNPKGVGIGDTTNNNNNNGGGGGGGGSSSSSDQPKRQKTAPMEWAHEAKPQEVKPQAQGTGPS